MSNHKFTICVQNDNYEVSLEKRKLYEVLPDSDASTYEQICAIEESGEDYLYPQDYFVVLDLPEAQDARVLGAA